MFNPDTPAPENTSSDALFSRAAFPIFVLSGDTEKQARKNLSSLLQRLASLGQVHAARALSTSESTVSRMKEGEFERMANILAALGLKAVSTDMRCMSATEKELIQSLAKSLEEDKSVELQSFGDAA